jgi:hypothetical protein
MFETSMRISSFLPPFLLTLASLLFIYIGTSYIVSPDQVIRPLIILCLILAILTIPVYFLTRDWNWTGLLLVVIVLGLFSSTLFASAYSITVFSILLLSWLIHKILKRNLVIGHVFLVLNATSLIAIILSLTVLYSRIDKVPPSYYRAAMEAIDSKNYTNISPKAGIKPDIYFIVVDGYGRADTLQQLYGLDNSQFIGFLEQHGFTVSRNSRSNYPKTILSITSILNMEYIQTLVPQLDNSILWWLMSPWLDHSRVRTSLEKIGYTSVSISTDWSITDNPTTDYYFKSHLIMLSDFERYFLGVTPLRMVQPLLENVSSVATFGAHRRSVLKNFSSLIESTSVPGPKLVVAHILLPHPPFVFSSAGGPLNPRYSFSFNDASDYPGTPGQYRDKYADQVLFLNSQLEKVIESILENSRTPPIIILQADHGPGMLLDSISREDSCLAERFSIFSAYHLPGMDSDIVPDDLTSVNLFRVIFNEYFGANLPMLENRQYFPGQVDKVYDLEDVTAEIGDIKNCSAK